MRLLIIRHGVAEDREEFAKTGQDDALRPLTKDGKWKMARVAKGLRAVVPAIDVLASSGLVRADQTAAIVAERYDGMDVERVAALAPDQRSNALLPWLLRRRREATAAVVGHDPHLPALVAWLTTGRDGAWLGLKKGGACLLEFDGAPRARGATLLWVMTPAQLRGLGR